MAVKAYAARGPKQRLEPFEYEPGPLGKREVDVRISHCGICHSDLALIDNEWGNAVYPVVAGHEVVGTVAASENGSTGWRSGRGSGSAGTPGRAGTANGAPAARSRSAPQERATIVNHHGGWAESVRVDAKFAVPLPDAARLGRRRSADVRGSTVFTPMAEFGVEPWMRTAVVGIGGLGHLACSSWPHLAAR